MEIEETVSETAEVLPADETSTEIVSSDQVVRDEELSETELVNRIILQLQYNEDMQAERDRVLQEKLDKILSSVSSNDIEEDVSAVEDVVSVVPASPDPTISMNDVRSITRSLSTLVSETVSQNEIDNNSIMYKHMTDYSVSESFLALMFFGIFILCVLSLKKG